ncbi:MAG: DUF5682 family protein [Candidatus Xenobiia bacterium LiM19]
MTTHAVRIDAEDGPHIFGVRHLSPSGAWHLRAFLDEIRPTAVLIEGLSDAGGQIPHLTSKNTVPPVAILAYTEELPVRTLLYPFASYSPEYQALMWAMENGAYPAFIDLPSDVFMSLESSAYNTDSGLEGHLERPDIYRMWAEKAGETDHESCWERSFEHNLNPGAYRKAACAFGLGLRNLEETLEERPEKERAENLIREAFMRREIRRVSAEGHDPRRIAVVCGAFHASALGKELPPMEDEELARLPRLRTRLTLMPYSYFRLSSRSGYGAGNPAPMYFQMMWECILEEDLSKLPALYFSRMVQSLRESGTCRSPADVIEGVRLANALSALYQGSAPTLADLRDAAVVSLGQGDLGVIAEAHALTVVGTSIGSLPEGVSQTPIQDDFNRELRRLKLEKYKSTVAQDLELDLRENRQVKSGEAARLDLNRSFFLNRLKVLSVRFAAPEAVSQQSATWAEHWILQWTPEAEIELVESTLRGETVELAAGFVFNERLEASGRIEDAALVIRDACLSGMPASMEQARAALQRLAVDNSDFIEVASAAWNLSVVISYGDIRRFDALHYIPLMKQLFLRGTLLLLSAAGCNNEQAAAVIPAMNAMHAMAQSHCQEVDEALWLEKLNELSGRDDRNAKLSGFACALLLEKGMMESGQLAAEVLRRLSPGVDADLGAGWFEGLALRNRYALLSRVSLWESLSAYVISLDEEQFRRALVFLRRAFSDFEPGEKRTVAEILGEIWGIGREDGSDLLSREMSDKEKEQIQALNEFDFDNI